MYGGSSYAHIHDDDDVSDALRAHFSLPRTGTSHSPSASTARSGTYQPQQYRHVDTEASPSLANGPPFAPAFVAASDAVAAAAVREHWDRTARTAQAASQPPPPAPRAPVPTVQHSQTVVAAPEIAREIDALRHSQQRHGNRSTQGTGLSGHGAVARTASTGTHAGTQAGRESSPVNAQVLAADQARVRWAFSVDRTGRVQQPLMNALSGASIRDDLVDVVRLLSAVTDAAQTTDPSFTAQLAGIDAGTSGTEHTRSVAVQNGIGLGRRSAAVQVVEGDIASAAPTAQLDYDRLVSHQQSLADADGREHLVHPSAYRPHCAIPAADFPVMLAEARRLGVANRYGFVALPQPPVALPPRRKVRAVQPVHYPHLYGTHPLALDDHVTSQLSRAYGLWVQGTGFVPKF